MSFPLEEATIASIHAAFRGGALTATQLVRGYLARIEAYDRQGPALRALITVNPAALEEATRLDAEFKANRDRIGPLHGIPIVLKDNFNTKDLPTTGGSVALKDFQPSADAFTVDRLRRAGAIILGKANMTEFARGGISVSSLGGQVRNPYDLARTPGGSSGGTGAAIAANFAAVGTGSDTGQSIRSPASACSLVGVRPTRGLVSRTGVMPNSFIQDEVGPITRTVEDAARMLDVMVGYDPQDPVTALGFGKAPASYLDALDAGALQGAHIGVMANLHGTQERHSPVNQVMEQVARRMEEQGATVVRFELAGYEELAANVANDAYEAAAAFDAYLAGVRGGAQAAPAHPAESNGPVGSFEALVASRTAHPFVQSALEAELTNGGPDHPTSLERVRNREKLRILVAAKMAELRLDAILYPQQRILVVPIGERDQAERNGVLSHGTGFPAVTFPGGFSAPTETAPLGVPVGAELLGLDYTEPRLLALAYAFEQAAGVRRAPVGVPAL
ncbi:MAG: amidase [Ramlibacter sp.]